MLHALVSSALMAAVLVLGGCMTTHEISVSTEPNGTVTKTEKSATGWAATPVYTVPYGYSYGHGGYHILDRRFRGQYAPKPGSVVLGRNVSSTLVEAEVDGVMRLCTRRGGEPHSCTNQNNARNWPLR